jgi:hypothetical protein
MTARRRPRQHQAGEIDGRDQQHKGNRHDDEERTRELPPQEPFCWRRDRVDDQFDRQETQVGKMDLVTEVGEVVVVRPFLDRLMRAAIFKRNQTMCFAQVRY